MDLPGRAHPSAAHLSAANLRPVPARRGLDALDAASTDAVLARGEPGLAFLAEHGPRRARAARWPGVPAPPPSAGTVADRHRRHRGVDLAALAGWVEALRSAARRVRHQHSALAEEAGNMWDVWDGPGSTGVADRVVDVGRATHGFVTAVEGVADAIETAAVAVADALAGLSRGALDLLAGDGGVRVGGWTASEVDRACTADGPGAPAVRRAYAADLDDRVRRYLDTADATDRAVDDAWADLADRLTRMLDEHDAARAPLPAPPEIPTRVGLPLGPPP